MWIGGGVVFLALFALVLIAFPQVRVPESVDAASSSQQRSVSETGKRAVAAVEELLERHGKRAPEIALDAADISMRPGELVALVARRRFVLALVGLAIGGPLMAAILAGLAVFAARGCCGRRGVASAAVAFGALLPDVLQLLTSSLRSGYGMTQALDAVAAEAQEPARAEFQRGPLETRLGRDLTEAMGNRPYRMQSPDMEWVASAIAIHQETGGNLAEILETRGSHDPRAPANGPPGGIADRRGAHLRLHPHRPALRTGGILKITNPDYFAELTHGGGLAAVAVAGCLMGVGWIWMRTLVNIRI